MLRKLIKIQFENISNKVYLICSLYTHLYCQFPFEWMIIFKVIILVFLEFHFALKRMSLV